MLIFLHEAQKISEAIQLSSGKNSIVLMGNAIFSNIDQLNVAFSNIYVLETDTDALLDVEATIKVISYRKLAEIILNHSKSITIK